MPISRRYQPEHGPHETCSFGFDFSPIIPVGVGITQGQLDILFNNATGGDASGDWTVGPIMVRGRAIYATLTGGVLGVDYQLHWSAFDTQGNIWGRVGLILCGYSS